MTDYVRKVHQVLIEGKEKIIMVHKNMLSKDDIKLIKKLEKLYHKKVKLSSLQEIMNNQDVSVCVVK